MQHTVSKVAPVVKPDPNISNKANYVLCEHLCIVHQPRGIERRGAMKPDMMPNSIWSTGPMP